MNENKQKKISFFKRIKLAIFNLENYDMFAAEPLLKAIGYFIKLVLLFSAIISIAITHNFITDYKNTIKYVEENIPDFTYQDGNIIVKQEDTIVQEQEEGVIIINTLMTSESDEAKEQIEKLKTYQNGVLLMKDKFALKLYTSQQIGLYTYQDILGNIEIQSFTKAEAIEYIKNIPTVSIGTAFYLISVMYLFTIYIIIITMDILILSLLGLLTSRIAKIRLRYVPIINMSIYALTLPILLNALYIIINTLTGFEIQYFQIVYNAISYIYLVTAILMIKSEMIKQQIELMRLADEQKKVKEELEKTKEEEKDKDKEKKEEKGKKDNKENGEAPEGTT